MNRTTYPSLQRASITIIAVALSAILAGCASGGGTVDTTLVESRIKNARTAADHEELAKHFESEAAKAHAEGERHHRMASVYSNAPSYRSMEGLALHCERLTRNYENQERDNKALAEMHRKLAANAGS